MYNPGQGHLVRESSPLSHSVPLARGIGLSGSQHSASVGPSVSQRPSEVSPFTVPDTRGN